jgi:hypothetical protein
MNPFLASKRGEDQTNIEKIRIINEIGQQPTITPELLHEIGLLSKKVYDELERKGLTQTSISDIYGGMFRFVQPRSPKLKREFDEYLYDAVRILEMKHTLRAMVQSIDQLLHDKVHEDDEAYLSSDLPIEIRKMAISREKNLVTDPNLLRILLKQREMAVRKMNNIGYYRGIYGKLKFVLMQMTLELSTFSVENLSLQGKEINYNDLNEEIESKIQKEEDGWW